MKRARYGGSTSENCYFIGVNGALIDLSLDEEVEREITHLIRSGVLSHSSQAPNPIWGPLLQNIFLSPYSQQSAIQVADDASRELFNRV